MCSLAIPSHATRGSKLQPFAKATSQRGWLIGVFAIGMWLFGSPQAVRGQSALDGFVQGANDEVRVIVVQPDGKILIGGDFGLLVPNGGGSVSRRNIARLNPDGTVDTAFNPDANGIVLAIAVQADGKILVGGHFTQIGGPVGPTRNHIARLDAITGLPDSFNPNASNDVDSIAVQPDGKILAGGLFTTIGGQSRSRIARLDATTGLADAFNPNASTLVSAIVVQADGKILVGGAFLSIGGQNRNRIARLNGTTGLADSFNPNANNFVSAIAVQADGKILVSGGFTGANSIGGQTRNRIARLDATTGLADSFNPNANGDVSAIAVQADGKHLVGGRFNSIGGQTRNAMARLDSTTGLADSLDPNPSAINLPFTSPAVNAIAVQPDGKILAGGLFTKLAPNGGAAVIRNSIARLEPDGKLDQTLDVTTVGSSVLATAVQPDGKILIGGTFTSVLGIARNNLARLNKDGTLDTAFNPNANGTVRSIVVQADGKILTGGDFTGANSIGGQARNFIARLDATTGLADPFDPNANNSVLSIVMQADGKILVGGFFTVIGGEARSRIARLEATTGLADSFDPNANDVVFAIALQADGKILVGGDFNGANSIGGQLRNYIARLDPTTGLADSFDPNAKFDVYAIAVQADGKILAGGAFTGVNSIGGQTRNFIARLDATTGLADSFNPNAKSAVLSIAVQADGKVLVGGIFSGTNSIGGQLRNRIARLDAATGLADSFDPNANSDVQSIVLQSDGKILAGGNFSSIGGQSRSLFARLSNDTAALQKMAATQTSIAWTLGGSSPQFTRVTFEYANDNVNYSPLGNGTPAGSNWTRSGLNLATGRSFYIRARGYYRNGFQNGAESMMESVQNAFVAGPTAADSTISGRIVANDSAPIAGAVVNLTGAQTRKTITDANGNYRFDRVETGGFYTVMPMLVNFSFTPAGRSFSQLGNRTEAMFTAVRNAVDTGNVIDTAEYFVRQQYLDFLAREPDQEGWLYWSDQINQCLSEPAAVAGGPAPADCLRQKRLDVSAAFFMSEEFQRSGNYLYRIYRAGLSRPVTYAEFTADHQKVVGGSDLALRRAQFADELVQRSEFLQKYQGAATAETFVASLLQGLLMEAQVDLASRREALIATYQNAGDLDHGRSAVLQAVADTDELQAAVYHSSFVLMEYFGYLRRDIDQSGFEFWVQVLNNRDLGNHRGMVCSFLTSVEYQQRFGTVISRSNGECGQ